MTLKAAINALNPVCDKWYKIGVQLEVPIPNLKNIDRDSMDRLCDTLDYWMKTDPSPSWRQLVDALEAPSVGETKLAKEIEQKYCSPRICVESETSLQAQCHQGTYVCILCHGECRLRLMCFPCATEVSSKDKKKARTFLATAPESQGI